MAASHSHGPHIPDISGEPTGLVLFGVDITTTVFSTWLFMAALFVLVALLYIAIRTPALPRLRTLGLDLVGRLDTFLNDSVGDKKYARIYFPMLGGFFLFILLANFFGLFLDYLNLGFPVLHAYLRPFNSDMATTLALALAVIIVSHIAGMIRKGFFGHWKHYIFNFSGNSTMEKIVNVPVGWIHLIGEFSRVLSLSVRLFANIFAGVALIGVMAYLGNMLPTIGGLAIGELLVLPIWLFELLVAFIQAFIFAMLGSLYIREAVTLEHH